MAKKAKGEPKPAKAGKRAKGAKGARRRAPLVDRVTGLVAVLFLASLAVPRLVV